MDKMFWKDYATNHIPDRRILALTQSLLWKMRRKRKWKLYRYLLQIIEMATRETMKTTPAAAEPAIRGSCSLSSDLKSSAGENKWKMGRSGRARAEAEVTGVEGWRAGRDDLKDKRICFHATDRLTDWLTGFDKPEDRNDCGVCQEQMDPPLWPRPLLAHTESLTVRKMQPSRIPTYLCPCARLHATPCPRSGAGFSMLQANQHLPNPIPQHRTGLSD